MTRIVVLMAVAALTLSACGKRGELERPPPMWGSGQPTAPAAK